LGKNASLVVSPRPSPKTCASSQTDVSVASKCEDIDGILAPVMPVMPKLQELCGEPTHLLLMVYLQVDMHVWNLAVAST
jgi:hypothetical protein